MARIRTVKPDFWADVKLAAVSRDARLLFIGLFNFADDSGRLVWDARLVRARVFPFEDDLTAVAVGALMDELVAAGRVCVFTVDGETFGAIVNFNKHQKINRPVPSTIPAPPDGLASPVNPLVTRLNCDGSLLPHDSLTEDSMSIHGGVSAGKEGKGKEGKGKEGKGKERKGKDIWSNAARSTVLNEQFTKFWSAYPRRVKRLDAERAFEAALATGVDPDTVIAGAERYRDDPNRVDAWTRHPDAWLAAGSWDDDPLPDRSDVTVADAAAVGREARRLAAVSKVDHLDRIGECPDCDAFGYAGGAVCAHSGLIAHG